MAITIVVVKTEVDPQKKHEFEQTIIALFNEAEKSEDCLGWNVFREIKGNSYCIESEWQNKEMAERYLKSKDFKILAGAVHNLCNSLGGKIWIASLLEEKAI